MDNSATMRSGYERINAGDIAGFGECTNYILWGITREVVLELAREDGIDALEASFRAEQLAEADEIFVTGTSSGIVPIVTLNGVQVANGRVGPVTRRLMELYELRTGGANALAQAAWAH